MRKILILASNPKRDLALDREIRDLEGVVKRSRNRDEFEVKVGSAIRPDDLQELLLDYEPQIVHFCGHGTGEQGLVLQNSAGREQLVTTSALSSLFKLFTGKVECVLLNACYSEVQANAISQHINYVIGMSQTILDDAAIAFATGFYRGLGYGRTTEDAYHFGCNAIELMPSTTLISRSPAVQQDAPKERKLIPEVTVIPGAPIAVPEYLKPVLKTRQTLAAQPNSVNVPAVQTSETKRVEIAEDVSKALEQEAALKRYHSCVRDFLADNVLTPEEKLQLGQLAKQLGLDPAEAIAIFQEEERLRFASAPPGQASSPIQALLTSPSAQAPSQVQSPTRLSPFNLRSLLLGGGAVLLGLGIAVFSSHLFVKEASPSASPVSPSDSVSPPILPVSPLSNPGSSSAPDQPNHDEAKSLTQDSYSKLLSHLNEIYGECEANKAIAELQGIPSQSAVQPSPQEIISQWQQKWSAYQDHQNKIALGLKQNNFDAATAEADKITADYCKQDAMKLIALKKAAWTTEQQDRLAKVTSFLDAHDLASAKAIAEQIESAELKQEADKRIAAYVPPSPIVDPPIELKPPCYRVNVDVGDPLKVRADDDITDGIIGTAIDKLDRGTIVVSKEERQQAKHPERPEVITWLKISKPIEGWVAERQLEPAECQP